MQARIAPSLGELEGNHKDVWGTSEYKSDKEPTVFMGLYGLPDFFALWRHKGKKFILWCGSDITHFQNGYWLDDKGLIKIESVAMAQWINENCESWVENEVERIALKEMGIEAKVCQSFMGNIDDYKVEYKYTERPQVYISVSGNNFKLYGWDIIEGIADFCNVDFHLYGNTEKWKTKHSNVFVHGRVSKLQMNEEIKKMQCGLRLCVDMDGFSEITAKSILWGQYPIVAESYGYKHINSFRNLNNLVSELNSLKHKIIANPARDYYKKIINQYPWNLKK